VRHCANEEFERRGFSVMRRLLILTTTALVAGATAVAGGTSVAGATAVAGGTAVAGAQVAPGYNSGYNGWWPGGYGYPPVTVHAPGYPCSVTAYGPTFHSHSSGWTQDYGGGTSCAGGVGIKTLTISDQVLGQNGSTWHTVTGSTFTNGPTSGNPLHMIRTRSGFLGHVYRTVATAKLVVPNGHAGCSLTNTCSQTIVITATSRGLAP
jgi:hypothetical protein